MSQQGPILVVSSDAWPPFLTALDEAKMFPVIETGWADAARAVDAGAARRGSCRDVGWAPQPALRRSPSRLPPESPISR